MSVRADQAFFLYLATTLLEDGLRDISPIDDHGNRSNHARRPATRRVMTAIHMLNDWLQTVKVQYRKRMDSSLVVMVVNPEVQPNSSGDQELEEYLAIVGAWWSQMNHKEGLSWLETYCEAALRLKLNSATASDVAYLINLCREIERWVKSHLAYSNHGQ